jgi:hypothetical protein
VCHYPTGASKWNWVEHRLFSAISANWAGEPLTCYAKMLNFLNATTTQQGLVVKATLCETQYQIGSYSFTVPKSIHSHFVLLTGGKSVL